MQKIYVAHRRGTAEPVDFPVDWPSEEDAQHAWRWDAEHSPFPLTPLSAEFNRRRGNAQQRAAEALGASPGSGSRSIVANGYPYSEGGRGGGGGGGGLLGSAEMQTTLAAMAPRLDELWFGTWRPQIESEAREMADFDYDGLSLQDLFERFGPLGERHALHSDLMFRALRLVSFHRGELITFLREHFGPEADALVVELLQGVQNVSVESAGALWDIAKEISKRPAAVAWIESGPRSLTTIADVEGGKFLERELASWLDRYGRRNGAFGEISEPTWAEEPRVFFATLRQYLDGDDPRKTQERAAERRQSLTREIEAKLKDTETVERFRTLLTAALPFLAVRESRPFVNNMSRASLRFPALAAGRKLVAAGLIEKMEDVFFLTFDEIGAAARGEMPELRTRVEERRREHAYWREVVPPASIGLTTSTDASTTSVRGIAASGGRLRATARVIMTLTDGDRLQKGEVLVTRSTTPLWTPLFATAGAVVTDGGGLLSHCAILAREYGIPAVVGAQGATGIVRDGATIIVDGTQGIVTLES